VFDLPSIRLGRVFGIPIEVNASWLAIFVLVTYSLAQGVYPSIPAAHGSAWWVFAAAGAATSLLFFASILAHELCHSLVAKATGGNVDRITLFIFGGVAQIDEEPKTAGKEFLMAVAGPAASVVLAVVFFGGFFVTALVGAPWWVWEPLRYLAGINFTVGLFNLLPGFPLDGGRVLRSVLWGATGDLLKATRWAAGSGQAIGWAMVVAAVVAAARGSLDLIWFGIIGWFIASLAGQAYRQQVVRSGIAGVSVAQVMTPNPEYVSGELTLERLVAEHFVGGRHSRYPVMHDGTIVGVVSLSDVKRVHRAEWPFVATLDVTDKDMGSLVVSPDQPVEQTLARFGPDRPGMLLVVGEGRLVGVLTRSDVVHLIEVST
jgi:Zn-dependent protease/predicted transcriptional regulator